MATSPFAVRTAGPTAGERIEVGDRVTHDGQGLGRVVRIVDDHDVIIDFGRPEASPVIVSHLRLTKL